MLSVTSARNTSPGGTERRSLFLLPPSDVQTNKSKQAGSAEATSSKQLCRRGIGHRTRVRTAALRIFPPRSLRRLPQSSSPSLSPRLDIHGDLMRTYIWSKGSPKLHTSRAVGGLAGEDSSSSSSFSRVPFSFLSSV